MENFLQGLLVVIVLYRRKVQASAAYNSLRHALAPFPHLPAILIYDNSPQPSPIHDTSVTYVHDPSNAGVSKAYNAGAAVAREKDKQWMLLLDQDTTVNAGLFEKFQESVFLHPESVVLVPLIKDRKGLVSPFYFAYGRGIRLKTFKARLPLDKFRFINSGLLIQCQTFVRAGGYDENIPLDFSDISFGERLRKVIDHFRVVDIPLDHRLSATELVPFPDAVDRFRAFCRGAFAMGKSTQRLHLYSVHAFLRAFHLGFKYFTFTFVKIVFQEARNG